MKIDRLETHDRFQFFTAQDFDIGKMCQKIIDEQPFGNRPFYIFAHKREVGIDERIAIYQEDIHKSLKDPMHIRQFLRIDQIPTHRIIWQPRLSKPKAQENSMLFKGYPGTDNVKVIWIIPDKETWSQFEKDKMTGSQTVWESIQAFRTDREKMGYPEPDDVSDEEATAIYAALGREALAKKSTTFGPYLDLGQG